MLKKFIIKNLNKDLVQKLNGIDVSKQALGQYKLYVNNNFNESDVLLVKKLKRNWILGETIEKTKTREVRTYGNLYITMRNNEIVSIYNLKRGKNKLNIDYKLKKYIEIILDI